MVQLAATDVAEACSRVREAVAAGARFIVLPPFSGKIGDLDQAVDLGEEIQAALGECCGDSWVSTAVVRRGPGGGYRHCALLLGADGPMLEQPQVHPSERFAFSELADAFHNVDLPIGRVAVLTTDDSLYPETFRLLALAGVQVAAVPLSPLEDWELNTGLLERAAENRINSAGGNRQCGSRRGLYRRPAA